MLQMLIIVLGIFYIIYEWHLIYFSKQEDLGQTMPVS